MKKKTSQSNIIKLINSKGSISQECSSLLFDKTITNRYQTLEKYFIENSIQYNKIELKNIIKLIETQVYTAIEYISYLIYYIQQFSGNWGAAGEQQVKNAFLKCIFKIPASDSVSYEHYSEFENVIKQKYHQLGIANMPVENAKSFLKTHKFLFLGRLINSSDSESINRMLTFVGSHKFYFIGTAGDLHYYIFGDAKKTHVKEYTIVTYTKEDIHSPNVINALAALTAKHIIIVRNYSLETIFYQKWVPCIENNSHSYFQANPMWNISQKIKEKCLSLFNTQTTEELIQQKNIFLKDMKETIAHHELGHTIINHKYLSPNELGLGQATETIKETIYASMLEFFADFAPKHEGFLGPIQNICKIAKKDRVKAERMFYMYLSDVWFYDTPDEYMYLYSDLMLLILIRYIQKDQHINFEELEQDTYINKARNAGDQLTVLERLYELYIEETKEIENISKTATYQIIEEVDYQKASKIIHKILKEDNPLIPKTSDTYALMYWKTTVNLILNLSDSKQRLINYLEDQEKSILRKILILACGRKKAEAYNYDHRKFICDRMIELGFTSK